MSAVTARPITIAVSTSADGTGSTNGDPPAVTRSVQNGGRAARDVADRHDHQVNAGVDDGEADDHLQHVALGEHAPRADDDEQRRSRVCTASVTLLYTKPVDDAGELGAHLDADNRVDDGIAPALASDPEGARRKERRIEEAAGEHESQYAEDDVGTPERDSSVVIAP